PSVDAAVVQPSPVVDRATDTPSAAAISQAAARERRGGLRVSSPIELQVLEGDRVLGTTSDGPVVATAGKHELDFVNTEFGYQSHQAVEIKAGQIVPMKISPPDGRVSINAVPWATVSIDGNSYGETPLGNIVLPVGEHQITFRHPQLGERTQKVIVKANAATRVSTVFGRRPAWSRASVDLRPSVPDVPWGWRPSGQENPAVKSSPETIPQGARHSTEQQKAALRAAPGRLAARTS